jgi:hypothetical protein
MGFELFHETAMLPCFIGTAGIFVQYHHRDNARIPAEC